MERNESFLLQWSQATRADGGIAVMPTRPWKRGRLHPDTSTLSNQLITESHFIVHGQLGLLICH
jgi:hypothetical protein